MKKQLKKTKFWAKNKKLTIVSVLTVIVILAGTVFGIQRVHYYNEVANQAGIVNVRELIILAVRGLKKDAPVEPRTGDVYFPESKLYLPNPGIALPLTYYKDTVNVSESQSELSISTYPVHGTTGLYSANNTKNLFEAVPHFQACARGIKLVYEKFPQDDTQNILKHTVQLNNGKALYVYLEKDCPELDGTASLFVNIKAY